LVQACNKGIFGTAAEAIAETSVPGVKATRPYAPYKGRLQLGDIEQYPETALYIDVERYFRTKAAKPPSASSFVTRSSIANGEASAQSSNTLPGDTEMPDVGGDLSAVKMTRNYQVNDPGSYSGKKDVDRDDLAKGFEYGRTAVHISESDENVTKIETFQSFTIIGFIPSNKVLATISFFDIF
jgi:ATP-dependent DNA helicase 2 subunit 2